MSDAASVLFALLTFALTFIVARTLSRGWRERRKQKDEERRRAGESRQVRRARERRQK
jgi:hypothetical protein